MVSRSRVDRSGITRNAESKLMHSVRRKERKRVQIKRSVPCQAATTRLKDGIAQMHIVKKPIV